MTAKRRAALTRWRARTPTERAAVAEAFATLLAISVLVRFAPFRWIARLAERPVRAAPPRDRDSTLHLVRWAVRAAARRARFRAVCIEQGVAAQAMLRRRGIAATVFYGVAREPDGLTAHVWVRVGEADIVGCEEAPMFQLLARFEPRESAR